MGYCRLGRRPAGAAFAAAALLLICTSAIAQSAAPQFVYTANEDSTISAFQLNTSTGALTEIAGSPFEERLAPAELAVNPAGTLLFVANTGNYSDISVFQINSATGALTEIPNSPFAADNGTEPAALTTDPAGKFLYVANSASNYDSQQGEIDVYSIDPVTGTLTPSPNTQAGNPPLCPLQAVGMFMHPTGNWMYVFGDSTAPTGVVPSAPGTLEGYAINSPTGDLTPISNPYQTGGQPISMAGTGSFLFASSGPNSTDDLSHIDAVAISTTDGSLTFNSVYRVEEEGTPATPGSLAVDSTGNFLVTTAGVFMINDGFLPVTQDPQLGYFPIDDKNWSASRISSFVFGSDPAGVCSMGTCYAAIDSYQLNDVTGVLTLAPGSPYSIDSESEMLPFIVVTGSAPNSPAPSVEFSPTSLSFAATEVGQSSTSLPVVLYNTGSAPLAISGISITGADYDSFSETNNCAASLPASGNCTIMVTSSPESGGPLSADLSVTDNALGSPESLVLTGSGESAPAAIFTPASYEFPTTNIGSVSAPETITLTSSGNLTLQISGVSLSGANPGDFSESNNCGANLAPGANCSITVKFQPQTQGVRSATIAVSDNASSSPQSMTLSGTGQQPFNLASSAQNGTTATIAPTGTASYSLEFTPVGNFTGSVSVACTGAPANSMCAANPASFQANSSAAVPFGVTVSPITNSGAPAAIRPFAKIALTAVVRFATVVFAILVMVASFLVVRDGRFGAMGARSARLRGFADAIALAVALSLVLFAIGCGGGAGSGFQSAPSGMQPGQYTLTVTASSGGASQSLNLTLNVASPQ